MSDIYDNHPFNSVLCGNLKPVRLFNNEKRRKMKNKKTLRLLAMFVTATVALTFTGCNLAEDLSKIAEQTNSVSETDYDPMNLIAGLADQGESPEWVGKMQQASDADQLFVVAAVGKTTAYVSMHQKDENGKWEQIISTPGYIGKNGIGKEKEGDSKTPVGVFRFTDAFGIAGDPGCAIPYKKVTDDDYWSGDQRDGYMYNKMVSIKDYPDLDVESSEHIKDYTVPYQYCLNISYNEDGEAGLGSAIFLHCFSSDKPYTGGCVAIPQDKMITVMRNVREDCVVVIDTLQNISPDLYEEWDPENELAAAEETVNYSDDSSDFVLLSEAVPDAILEIRYYSTYNFVGDRIEGYEEPVALLTKEAAAALLEVSEELKEKGYRLKIYDAYRPQMAVTNFVEWAEDTDDTRMKEFFYPDLEKDVLFPQGYIAEHSGHSRGSTVDLTLFDMETEKELDMGGTFDFFGELSHPDYKDITEEQFNNRMILRDAMLEHGFRPLETEWWHFTLDDEPYPDTYFTFPVSSESVSE